MTQVSKIWLYTGIGLTLWANSVMAMQPVNYKYMSERARSIIDLVNQTSADKGYKTARTSTEQSSVQTQSSVPVSAVSTAFSDEEKKACGIELPFSNEMFFPTNPLEYVNEGLTELKAVGTSELVRATMWDVTAEKQNYPGMEYHTNIVVDVVDAATGTVKASTNLSSLIDLPWIQVTPDPYKNILITHVEFQPTISVNGKRVVVIWAVLDASIPFLEMAYLVEARSNDGGKTFQTPQIISADKTVNPSRFGRAITLPRLTYLGGPRDRNYDLMLAYADFDISFPTTTTELREMRSYNSGLSWTEQALVTATDGTRFAQAVRINRETSIWEFFFMRNDSQGISHVYRAQSNIFSPGVWQITRSGFILDGTTAAYIEYPYFYRAGKTVFMSYSTKIYSSQNVSDILVARSDDDGETFRSLGAVRFDDSIRSWNPFSKISASYWRNSAGETKYCVQVLFNHQVNDPSTPSGDLVTYNYAVSPNNGDSFTKPEAFWNGEDLLGGTLYVNAFNMVSSYNRIVVYQSHNSKYNLGDSYFIKPLGTSTSISEQ